MQLRGKDRKWLITAVALTLGLAMALSGCSSAGSKEPTPSTGSGIASDTVSTPSETAATDKEQSTGVPEIKKGENLVIPVSDISETANFYSIQVDGTRMEVLAVKATDGTIRTAFNTCQVCYDSGRGYYKQSGNKLVCQNCGNTFTMDKVEVTKGGCNPYPIFAEDKTVTDESITISYDFLSASTKVFANWKGNY
jgi:hypothetical protein